MSRSEAKRTRIICQAMDLFRAQGFQNTTVQQIADACEMSKGAFYLYFVSKQEIVRAIFEYQSDTMVQSLEAIRSRKDLTPRQKFQAHVAYQFDEMGKQQSLTLMLLNDAGYKLDEATMLMAQKLHADWVNLFEKFVIDLYGQSFRPRLPDLTLIVMGTINELYSQMLLHGLAIEGQDAGKFITDLADDLAQEFLARRTPFLDISHIPTPEQLETQMEQQLKDRALLQLEHLRNKANDFNDEEIIADLRATLDLLADAINAPAPNPILIQALLANLKNLPSLQGGRRELANLYKVKLL